MTEHCEGSRLDFDARGRGGPREVPAAVGEALPGRHAAAGGRCRVALLGALLAGLVLAGSGGAALAQAPAAEPEYTAQTVPLPAEGESVETFRRVVGGRDAMLFAGQSRSEVEIAVAPMPLAEIEGRLDSALDYLETVATALSRTLIRYRRLEAGGAANGEESTALLRRARLIDDFKKDLVAHANILIEAAEAKGAEMAGASAYLSVVRAMEVPDPPAKEEAPTAEQLARELVRQVRDEPPVHERQEPWRVPVDELVLELQPLRREQLAERVEAWLQILQRQVRERIRMDIALNKTDDQAQKDFLARLANDQQAVISATVQRLQAALTVLARRGGDTADASQYIANATGQRIDITDPTVFYAQARAWLFSPSGGVRVLLKVLQFFGVLAAFWLLSGILGAGIKSAIKRLPKTSSLLQNFLVGGVRRTVMLIGLIVAVSSLGISITPLAAAIGAAGLVVGLALQGTLSNFASGILILIYRPFDVGDVINAGGVFGKVDAMTLVSTRILTFDNQVNVVPNNAIWNNVITNATALDTRRVDMVFSIGYADDMAKAQAIIEDTVSSHPMVLESPAPTIKVNELGDNSVNFIVRPWSRTSEYWDVYWDLTRQIKERFDAEGVNIPFPQRDLHLSGPIEVVMKPDRGRGGAARADRSASGPEPHPASPSATTATTNEPGPADEGGGDEGQQSS